MDAIEFLRERKRKFTNGESVPALGADIDCNYEDVVKEIEEWSAAHPRKTRQSVFLEQYPEARIGDDGVMQIYPCSISASHRNARGNCVTMGRKCPDCRREFWLQEEEE